MIYKTVISFNPTDPEKIMQVMDLESGKQDRSQIQAKIHDDKIRFSITAKDVTALKASVNTIIKMLAIHEKTINLVKNGSK